MKTVGIVDYGMANLDSVARAVEESGGTPLAADREAELEAVGSIVLAGVGAFGDGMAELKNRRLDTVLRREALDKGACPLALLSALRAPVPVIPQLHWPTWRANRSL